MHANPFDDAAALPFTLSLGSNQDNKKHASMTRPACEYCFLLRVAALSEQVSKMWATHCPNGMGNTSEVTMPPPLWTKPGIAMAGFSNTLFRCGAEATAASFAKNRNQPQLSVPRRGPPTICTAIESSTQINGVHATCIGVCMAYGNNQCWA